MLDFIIIRDNLENNCLYNFNKMQKLYKIT